MNNIGIFVEPLHVPYRYLYSYISVADGYAPELMPYFLTAKNKSATAINWVLGRVYDKVALSRQMISRGRESFIEGR